MKNYHLHLTGFVGDKDFDEKEVQNVLDKNQDNEVFVLIDSLGGSVKSALTIATAFKMHGNVTVHLAGMNASAATIASLGAKRVTMDKNAMYLVHKCSSAFFEWGMLNADQFAELIADIEKAKADLDKLDLNIAQMYSDKCKKDPKDLLDIMAAGGWLNATDALNLGFVDEITDLGEKAPKLTAEIATAMAAAGMPVPPLEVTIPRNLMSTITNFVRSLLPGPSASVKDCGQEDPRIAELQTAVNDREEKIAQLTARIEELESSATQSEQKIQDLQAAAEKDAATIAELKNRPADSTATVIDSEQTTDTLTTEDPIIAYYNGYKSAAKLYNSIP